MARVRQIGAIRYLARPEGSLLDDLLREGQAKQPRGTLGSTGDTISMTAVIR
jgi:hypothetical protein